MPRRDGRGPVGTGKRDGSGGGNRTGTGQGAKTGGKKGNCQGYIMTTARRLPWIGDEQPTVAKGLVVTDTWYDTNTTPPIMCFCISASPIVWYFDANYTVSCLVNHDDTSPVTLYTAPAGTVVVMMVVVVKETWNDGAKSFIVGDAADPDGFVTDIGIGLESTGFKNIEHDEWGDYLWHNAGSHPRFHFYAAETAIVAAFTGVGDGGSQGQCQVNMWLRHLRV